MRETIRKACLRVLAAAAIVAAVCWLHRPYFEPLTEWMPLGGGAYRLEAWHDNMPLVTDTVRVVLRHRDGGVAAVSVQGYLPKLRAAQAPPKPGNGGLTFRDLSTAAEAGRGGPPCMALADCGVSLVTMHHPESDTWSEFWLEAPGSPPAAQSFLLPSGRPQDWAGRPFGFYEPAGSVGPNICWPNLIAGFLFYATLFIWPMFFTLLLYQHHRRRRPQAPKRRGWFVLLALGLPYAGLLAQTYRQDIVSGGDLLGTLLAPLQAVVLIGLAALYYWRRRDLDGGINAAMIGGTVCGLLLALQFAR